MPTIKVDARNLESVLFADLAGVKRAFRQGTLSAAHKARTRLVHDSPVDRGMLKNAWEVKRGTDDIPVRVENSAPYAGVIERGARPGAQYGPAALEALAGWVQRKLLKARGAKKVADLAEAHRIARAIINKWEKLGRQGTWYVKKLVPHFGLDAHAEVIRAIKRYFEGRRG